MISNEVIGTNYTDFVTALLIGRYFEDIDTDWTLSFHWLNPILYELFIRNYFGKRICFCNHMTNWLLIV